MKKRVAQVSDAKQGNDACLEVHSASPPCLPMAWITIRCLPLVRGPI